MVFIAIALTSVRHISTICYCDLSFKFRGSAKRLQDNSPTNQIADYSQLAESKFLKIMELLWPA